MATIFNSYDCTTFRKNTGFGDCFADPKLILGGFLVPKNFRLAGADLASKEAAITALRAAAVADSKGQRIFPVHGFKNPQDNTDETTKQTFSDGSEAVVREGLMKWMFQITTGGLCVHRSLRTHNQNGGYFIFYDADFTLYGWAKNPGEIWGVPCNYLWTQPWRMNDGSNVTNYMIEMAFAPRFVNEGVGYARLEATIEGIQGLQDVSLTQLSFNAITGVAEISAQTECSAVNMAELYGAELSNAAAWNVINGSTGEPVAIDAVAVTGGTDKRFQLTLDTNDADYPSNGTVLVSLAAVSTLDGLGVEGFESNQVIIDVAVGSS